MWANETARGLANNKANLKPKSQVTFTPKGFLISEDKDGFFSIATKKKSNCAEEHVEIQQDYNLSLTTVGSTS